MLFIFILNLIAVCSSTVVIKPTKTEGLEAGFVLIQGAQIDSSNYYQFGLELQSKFPGKLWIAMPQFPLSVPEPLLISQQINSAFDGLKKSGCDINKNMPFFFAGHSLGGIIVQDYLLDNNTRNLLPVKFAGLILEGAYVERKNRDKLNDPTIPNILTIGGELDGLNRITRMTEAFYFDMQNKRSSNLEIITLIVKGMNHYQFAGEGEPPYLVKQNDIKSEITDAQARDQITSFLTSFIKISLNISTDADKNLLQNQLSYTSSLVNPIIEAFKMEGNYHIDTPCYKASSGANCTKGCPWSRYSQQIMGSLNFTIIGSDLFFPASQVFPDPLPKIHNNCFQPQTNNCTLNISTVSEAIYATGESMDTALQPIASIEIRSKLMSRQSVLLAATGIKYDFKETDDGNLCSDINKESIRTADKLAPDETLARYNQIGRKLAIGSDIDMSNEGPLWIWTPISYENKDNEKTGQKFTEVKAPLMKFSVDYPIKLSAGFHFCKVLSPARALEWIYVDSLKP